MKALKLSAFYCSMVLAGVGLPSIVSVVPGISINHVHATEAERKTVRVPALREKVYSQLARAQKLADDGDVAAGLAALDSIKERASSMNEYEVAMMHNFYGFIYYNQNDLDKAITSFEAVVNQNAIPESLKLNTFFSLAQLALANSQYDKVVAYLNQWDDVNTAPKKDSYYVLKAQALYQSKEYKSALENINMAISLAENDNLVPKENWLVLQRALYYSMNQPKQVVTVLEKMIALYDKPAYWVQLGGMYGEVGEDKKQLSTLETAYQRGFITSKSDVRSLSQVYLLNGLAYKSAQLMKQGMKTGTIENDSKNNAFIAEALVQAKEERAAISHFIAAAEVERHGKFDQRLAEVYLNLELFDEAADAARAALDKGGLDLESNAYIALGMAQYNLTNYDASILAFERAEKYKKSENLAKQWIKYVKREKTNAELLKTAYL